MDRPAIKAQARQALLGNIKLVFLGSFLLVVLTVVFSEISSRLLSPLLDEMENCYIQMLTGKAVRIDKLSRLMEQQSREILVDRLLDFLLIIVRFGFLLFLFRILRGKHASCGNLLDGFAVWWKILLLELLISLVVALWSLLLVIPGIIASYRYRMAAFLLLTHPEYGVLDCMRESKRLTQGHKMDFFLLDLSFLGWLLLTTIPYLGWIAMLWVSPYRAGTELLYCMNICGPSDQELWDQEDPRFPGSPE